MAQRPVRLQPRVSGVSGEGLTADAERGGPAVDVAGDSGALTIQGFGAGTTPSGAIGDQVGALGGVSQLAGDPNPAHQLLGAGVGYLSGAGRIYVGDVTSPQGSQPVSIASEAASDGRVTVSATVVGATSDSGSLQRPVRGGRPHHQQRALARMRDSATRRRTPRVDRRSIAWRRLALLGVLVAAGAWWFARPPAPGAQRHGTAAVLLGATDPNKAIDFALVLRLPGQARRTRFLNEVTDPAAPDYRHFIDAAAFGERFGVARSVLNHAKAQLARDGIRVTAGYPQRTALDVRATARNDRPSLRRPIDGLAERSPTRLPRPTRRCERPRQPESRGECGRRPRRHHAGD